METVVGAWDFSLLLCSRLSEWRFWSLEVALSAVGFWVTSEINERRNTETIKVKGFASYV